MRLVQQMRKQQDLQVSDRIAVCFETKDEAAIALLLHAEYIKAHVTKPCAAFIAGATAPPGKRMGHAGAIISGGSGTAAEKQAALEAAGVEVAHSPADMGTALQRAIAKRK